MLFLATLSVTMFGCDAPEDADRSADIADFCEPYVAGTDGDFDADDAGPRRELSGGGADRGASGDATLYVCGADDVRAFVDAGGVVADVPRFSPGALDPLPVEFCWYQTSTGLVRMPCDDNP